MTTSDQYDCQIVLPEYDSSPQQVRFSRPGSRVEQPARELLQREMEADGVVFDKSLVVDDQVQRWMDKYPQRYRLQYRDQSLEFIIRSPDGDRGLTSQRIHGDSPEDLAMLELLSTVTGPEGMTEELRHWMWNRDIDGEVTPRGMVYNFDSKLCDYDDLFLRARFSISWDNLADGAARLCALTRGEHVE